MLPGLPFEDISVHLGENNQLGWEISPSCRLRNKTQTVIEFSWSNSVNFQENLRQRRLQWDTPPALVTCQHFLVQALMLVP